MLPRLSYPRVPLAFALFVVIAMVACSRGGGRAPEDGGADFAPVDLPQTSDVSVRPLALDFSATGCVALDSANSRCDGTVPLTLVFTPIASSELTEFLWSFGDQTPSSQERSPRHTYVLPGPYTVTLTAGGGPGVGSVKKIHAAYIYVAPAPAGAWCDVDQQCAGARHCWCGSSDPCTPVLSRGLCGQACDAPTGGPSLCPDGTTCADLTVAASPVSGAGGAPVLPTTNAIWRRPLCLPACNEDRDCVVGSRCRSFSAPTATAGWVRVCFGSYPLEIGSRCGDDSGQPVNADCASRLCADLGAFGRCAADCSVIGCPLGSTCARFGGGRNLCLADCAGQAACNDDPLLACEAAGAPGPLGFTVAPLTATDAAAATTYCAPKRCATAADCGLAGTCPAGHCQRITL
jgi:PKD repeat protein